jgi:hypothetical protein
MIWAEMARRKVQFHPHEEWQDIRLWGLFLWGSVSPLLKTGELLTDMAKDNRTIWVRPSQAAWERHIEPLIKAHSLEELTRLAGW